MAEVQIVGADPNVIARVEAVLHRTEGVVVGARHTALIDTGRATVGLDGEHRQVPVFVIEVAGSSEVLGSLVGAFPGFGDVTVEGVS